MTREVLRHCAVLDIETGPNVEAMLRAEPRPATETDLAALHRLRAAAVLTFDLRQDEGACDLRFVRIDEDIREQEMVARIDRALPDADGAGRLLTFNGRAWDLPMLMQRAAATWCFSAPRLAAWNEASFHRHLDMMHRGGPRSGRGWSSLADRAAAIGVDMRLLRGKAGRTLASVRRRCTADVAATFLLYIADEAVRRSDARFFARSWLALAEAVRDDIDVFRDLRYLAEHPVLDGCRALAGSRSVYTTSAP